MSYVLGVDAGSTRTSAAVCHLGGAGRSEAEVVGLGGPGGGVATCLQLTADGDFAVGEPGDPRWTASDFVRRVGDDVPVVLGADPCTPQELVGLLVAHVARRVAEREGEPPAHVVLSHPPGWGPHARALVHAALRDAGLARVTLLPEPLAVAADHAENHRARAGLLAVLGVGSHATTSALVRLAPNGEHELLAWSEEADRWAGADLDDLVFAHVAAELGGLDPAQPHLLPAVARLRRDCESAKRVLSGVPVTAVPVHLPDGRVDVELTRERFEELARPGVELAVRGLERLCRGHRPDAIALVGGTARTPLLASAVAAAVPGRLVLAAAPEACAVRGAALAGRRLLLGPDTGPDHGETSVLVHGDDPSLRFPVGQLAWDDAESAAPPPRPPVEITPLDLPTPLSVKRVVRRGLAPIGRSRRGGRSERDPRHRTRHDEDGR
ncbi:Hsp70 family protein [Actinosynnema pretiosum]|uniref:Molecular chaperone-like protein n=1 Tax=Actinosynnema pretiosum TaxID=42197 RepID=A0A290Z014_9PSEU|nr:Hsp70 family protein [Actinosynnema pretiosum]ATE52361.1 molecular chaperone-like protein [Actinosynnema pretiosum]